jgi:hypothetical protein
MQLRDHPLMKYHGVGNWPPVWTWRGGEENKNIRGEVGIVRDVFLSVVEPRTRLFLIVEHEANEYIGCLIFDDSVFCGQIHTLLLGCRNQTVAQVGDLEVSQLL